MSPHESSNRFALFGGTSAIGFAVAREFAADGAEIFLAARDPTALERARLDLETRGARSVDTFVCNFEDTDRLPDLVEKMGRANYVLIAFGSLPDQRIAEKDPTIAKRHLTTNFIAPALLLDLLASQAKSGDCLAMITSVAGDRGRQSNYIYGAAKGGMSRFLEGLRHRLAPQVRVIDVRPGFVRTPMTDGLDREGPLWAEPDTVAKKICQAMRGHQSGTIYVPKIWRPIMAVVRNIPAILFHKTKL